MNSPGKWGRSSCERAAGFSLVETVIALAVIAVTFIGLIGLLGLGVANDQASSEQTQATNIAASIITDLRSTPSYSATGISTRYNLTLPTTITPLSSVVPVVRYFDNSQNLLGTSSGAAFKANVYLTRALSVGPTPSQITDLVRVVVSWPAQTATTPVGNVDVITQFRIN